VAPTAIRTLARNARAARSTRYTTRPPHQSRQGAPAPWPSKTRIPHSEGSDPSLHSCNQERGGAGTGCRGGLGLFGDGRRQTALPRLGRPFAIDHCHGWSLAGLVFLIAWQRRGRFNRCRRVSFARAGRVRNGWRPCSASTVGLLGASATTLSRQSWHASFDPPSAERPRADFPSGVLLGDPLRKIHSCCKENEIGITNNVSVLGHLKTSRKNSVSNLEV